MGMSARAEVAFGVDLGNPEIDEWNFELEDYALPAPWDEDETPDWDDLISEFGGWSEVALPWGDRGSAEHDARSEQYHRELAVRGAVGIDYGSYGYELGGVYLYVGPRQRSEWGCEPLDALVNPESADVERLMDFLTFLDGKGLRLKSEFRNAHWLLMASYG